MLLMALLAAGSACSRPSAQRPPPGGAPPTDEGFRERDAALLRDVDALTRRCSPNWRTEAGCLAQACQLRTREIELFALVRTHEFTDITESNYWHRGRLKFPGDLEQLLRRLNQEAPQRNPLCPPLRGNGSDAGPKKGGETY
jgi:hypothetical protein